MDQPLYDIYVTGKLVEGSNPDTARQQFASLFKTSPEAAGKLLNGTPQLLKRGLSKEEALKYKGALHKIGVMVAFKAHQAENNSTAAATPPPQPIPAEATTAPVQAPTEKVEKVQAENWSLAPVGADVLKPGERREISAQDIDTSAIKLASVFSEPQPIERPPVATPDTSHLSVAQVGADLLENRPTTAAPPELNLDGMTLAPPGSDLEQLKRPDTPVTPDISGITIAETGADLLEGQVKPTPPPAPHTDHLKLASD